LDIPPWMQQFNGRWMKRHDLQIVRISHCMFWEWWRTQVSREEPRRQIEVRDYSPVR